MIQGGRASLPTAILLLAACSAAPVEQPRAESPALARVLPKSPAPPVLAAPAPLPPPPAEPAPPPPVEPAPPPRDARPRIAAIGDQARIWRHPEREGLPLGYIRPGTSILLASPQPVEGKDCSRGYYKVEPRGYVCLDQRSTTLDLEDPYFRALAEFAPRLGEVWPYRYAFSNGAPMYSRIPAPDEQEKAERGFGPAGSFVQLAEWSRGHEELIESERIPATDPVPDIFAGGRRKVSGGGVYDPARLVWRVLPNGSMVSYARAFEAEGRVWLVTPDLMLVPADRVRPFRRSTFHGARLGEEVRLPIAWNRASTPRPRYVRNAETGEIVASGEPIAPKRFVQISGERLAIGGRGFFEIRGEPGAFVAEDEVTVTRPRTRLPQGVLPGQKWIEARIVPGTMTAYEGLVPVYATLFSPGKGGAPIPGFDPYKHSMTKTGFFPIEWKERVALMSPDKEWPPKTLWFSDVPSIQYLRAPLAMHVSYWHEDFGNPKSAECLNVSPEDGHFLFGWTDPPLPEGWAGVRPGDGNGPATPVVVTAI